MNADPYRQSHESSQNAAERRLLVAVSEQKEHLLGLRFVSSFLHSREGVLVELFFLLPPRRTTLRGPYGTIMGEGEMDPEIFNMHLKRGEQALQEAELMLLEYGFPQSSVTVKLSSTKEALQWDVLQEVQTGRFQALVMGNRGRTWLERALEGEVDIGEELLHATCSVPLWICATPREHGRDVLLCLDGSEMAYGMAGHVAGMLRGEERHKVMMLRVKREKPAGSKTPEEIFARAGEILHNAGLTDQRIDSKVVEDNDVARAILAEAESGNYAVVATGRHGVGRGMLQNLFMGSVSEKLFRKMQQGSLWVQC